MKTNGEKFCVANNLGFSVLREHDAEDAHYALIKISLLGKNTFCICALDGGYAFECLGENEENAKQFFDKVISDPPATEHLFDIVTDMRRIEIYLN